MRKGILKQASIALLLLLGSFGTASAQQGHELAIRDGQIYLDGQQLSQDNLPASLELDGLTASLQFWSDKEPVLHIDGTYYRIDRSTLVALDEVPEAENYWTLLTVNDGFVFFQSEEDRRARRAGRSVAARSAHTFEMEAPAELYVSADEMPHTVRAREHLSAVRAQAEALQRLSERGDRRQLEALTNEMLADAERAIVVVSDLSRMEYSQYLQDLQAQDRELYRQLMYEWELEAETLELARQIRQLDASPERADLIKQLNTRLAQIFELKQENRRREIAQLEAQLGEMEARLKEREDQRAAIIERRFRELTGQE